MSDPTERVDPEPAEPATAQPTQRERAGEAGNFRLGARLSDSALLLALATASIYVIGYQFELGFAKARGIPETLIVIGPAAMIAGVLGVASSGILVYFLTLLIGRIRPKRSHPTWFLVGAACTVATVISAAYVAEWTLLALGVITGAYMMYMSTDLRRLNHVQTLVLVSFCIAPGRAFVEREGKKQARGQTEFLVYRDDASGAEMALVGSYGEIAILASLDREAREFGPRYRLTKIENLDGSIASCEKIGPLHRASPVAANE